MKNKFSVTFLCCMIAWSGVLAQEATQSPGHLALGVEFLSTTGFGLELATPLSSHFALRGGISMFPYTLNHTFETSISESIKNQINTAVDNSAELKDALIQAGLPTRAQDINTDINATGSLGLVNGKILVDYYPSKKNGFHITGGLYIGPTDFLKVKGRMDEAVEVLNVLKAHNVDFFSETFVIDPDQNYKLSGNDIKDVRGSLKISSVKPYLGLGFGRAVPKSRVGVSFEIGAFYQGTPKIKSDNQNVQNFIDNKASDIVGVLNNFPVYPVLSLKVNFRLF